jgi:hypothetical protein
MNDDANDAGLDARARDERAVDVLLASGAMEERRGREKRARLLRLL